MALTSSSIAFGQPAFGPPARITVEEAGKRLAGPTLLTLKLADAKPAAVFQALAVQSGVAFDFDYDAQDHFEKLGKVSIAYQAQPFWDVLRDLSAKLDVSFQPYDQPRFGDNPTGIMIRVAPGANPDLFGPASGSGLLTVIASRTARSLILAKTASPGGNQRVQLDLIVLADPKIRTRGAPDGFDLEVHDGQGRPLTVEKPFSVWWTGNVTSSSPLLWHVTAVAQLSDVNVKSLQSVSGSLRFTATTSSQIWEIKDAMRAKGTGKSVDDTVFKLVKIEPREFVGPAFEVTLASWGKGEETDSGWPARSSFDLISSVRLLDASGNRFTPATWERKDNQDLAIIFTPGTPKGTGEPATLIWQLPTEVSQIIVPFKFTDVPLP